MTRGLHKLHQELYDVFSKYQLKTKYNKHVRLKSKVFSYNVIHKYYQGNIINHVDKLFSLLLKSLRNIYEYLVLLLLLFINYEDKNNEKYVLGLKKSPNDIYMMNEMHTYYYYDYP